jgi:hypothetical protein
MFRPYSAILRQLSNLLKLLLSIFNVIKINYFLSSNISMFLFFVIHSLKDIFGWHHPLRFHALPSFRGVSVSRVICVALMVVGVVAILVLCAPLVCMSLCL